MMTVLQMIRIIDCGSGALTVNQLSAHVDKINHAVMSNLITLDGEIIKQDIDIDVTGEYLTEIDFRNQISNEFKYQNLIGLYTSLDFPIWFDMVEPFPVRLLIKYDNLINFFSNFHHLSYGKDNNYILIKNSTNLNRLLKQEPTIQEIA